MNAMKLRHSRVTGWDLADAMDRNLDRHRRQSAAREGAESPAERHQAFMELIETERERLSLDAEMRSRGIIPPLGGRGKSGTVFLRKRRDLPLAPVNERRLPIAGYRDAPVNERRLPIVGYREIQVDDGRTTVLAVVTTVEDGVWKSDLMRMDPGTAAEIQAGLTGEDPVKVMDRMHRERREAPGKNPTPEGEERANAA